MSTYVDELMAHLTPPIEQPDRPRKTNPFMRTPLPTPVKKKVRRVVIQRGEDVAGSRPAPARVEIPERPIPNVVLF